MSNRKICVVVTARPSYSRIKTALSAIAEHPNLELQLVIAGSALLDRYGSAIEQIKKDGFQPSALVYNTIEGESILSAPKSTGLGIIELSSVFLNLGPDIVVTIADRFETMATAIAASYMNIPLAHVQGGEVTGNIDEKVRHSITKLSDYHFVASENARKRVLSLGENPNMVFNTGCPSIDLSSIVKSDPHLDFNPYLKYGGVGGKPDLDNGYIVVMQHPVTNEFESSRIQVEETLAAVEIIDRPVLWFWPNVDAGSDGTSKGIRAYREFHGLKRVHFFKNMEGKDFLKLLYNSVCLIGNSSVGIRECAFLGVPAINVGTRQDGRDRGNNVIDVGYNKEEILDAYKFIISQTKPQPSNVYGGGDAGQKIANALAQVELSFQKKITY